MTNRRIIGVVVSCVALVGSPARAQDTEPGGSRDSRNVFRDLGSGVVSLGRDTWAVVKAPVELDRRGALELAGVLAVGGILFAFDEDISEAVVRNNEEPFFRDVLEVGDFFEPMGLMGNTNIYWAGGAALGYIARLDRVQRMFQELLYSHWIAGATRQTVGRAIGRRRPNEGMGASTFDFRGGTSFPSGHSSTIFQVAAVFSHHIDWWPASVLLYGMAGSVAYQRVASESHWASDVWIGSLWGLAVAEIVIRLHEPGGAEIQPFVDPGGGVGLRILLPR